MPISLDDWFTLLAFLVGIPSTIIDAYYITHNGLGRDIWTLTPDQITKFFIYFFIQEVIYFAEVAITKIALLFFYKRIFPSASIKRLLSATVVINYVFGLIFIGLSIGQCTPINYFWQRWDGNYEGHCLSISGISLSNAIMSIILDFWMIAIPLWQIRSLHLNWKKKIGVGLMFSVGAL